MVRSTPAFLVGGKLVGALSQEDKGLGEAAGAAAAAAAVATAAADGLADELQQLMKLVANGDADLRAALDKYAETVLPPVVAAAGDGGEVYGGLSEEALYDMLSFPEVEGTLDRWGFSADDLWTLGEVQQLLREHRCVTRLRLVRTAPGMASFSHCAGAHAVPYGVLQCTPGTAVSLGKALAVHATADHHRCNNCCCFSRRSALS